MMNNCKNKDYLYVSSLNPIPIETCLSTGSTYLPTYKQIHTIRGVHRIGVERGIFPSCFQALPIRRKKKSVVEIINSVPA